MRQEKLSKLLDISIGRTPSRNEPAYWGEGHRWVSIRDLSSKTVTETKEQITDFAVREARCKIVKKGTLLFSFKLTIGKMAFAGCDLFTNEAIAAFPIKDERKLNSEFLYYALQSATFGGSNQAVMGKTLNSKSLAEIEIPLPPLDDQKRIAHLLGKVEGLIARRKQHLQQLDDLLKSVFLEMFGFRDQTYTKWSVDKLSAITEVVSGVTKGKKYTTEDLIEIPYMRVANVQDGHFVLDEIKTISVTQKEIDQYQLQSGDLLLTEGGDPDKLGRGSVWESQIEKCIHQNHIFRVRINDLTELNPYYLSALIGSRYGKSYFLKSAKQTTGIASINSTQLKNFPVVIPPIDLQNQFAAIVEKVEGLKSRYQQSLTDLESLYGALSQKAFKGELDLSRVVLTTEDTESTEGLNREKREKRERLQA
jgi:type I restriction enzyme S subunit